MTCHRECSGRHNQCSGLFPRLSYFWLAVSFRAWYVRKYEKVRVFTQFSKTQAPSAPCTFLTLESLNKTFTVDDKRQRLPLNFYSSLLILKALANEDTLLPAQMFPRLPACFVADTDFVFGTQKCFWFCSETFCVPKSTHFVSRAFARPRNIMGNNVSATMCPRLPGPLIKPHKKRKISLTIHHK